MSTKRRQPVRTGTEVWPGRGGRGRIGVAQEWWEARAGVRGPRRCPAESAAGVGRFQGRWPEVSESDARRLPRSVPGAGFRRRHPTASAAGTGAGFQGRCPSGSEAGTSWPPHPVPRGSRASAQQNLRQVTERFQDRRPANLGAGAREFPTPAPDGFRGAKADAPSGSEARTRCLPPSVPREIQGRRPKGCEAGARWLPRPVPGGTPGPMPLGLRRRGPGGLRNGCLVAPGAGSRWRRRRHPGGFRCPCGQKTDRPVRVVKRSKAATPATELPRSSRPGLQTHSVQRPGTTAMMPPPTPLLPGRPTR